MDFKKLQARAIEIRVKYAELEVKKHGRQWTREEVAQGFVGDVGDLMKLVMAKAGIREKEQIDEKLAHELSDCLWCIIVLADQYDVDLEQSFQQTMDELEKRIGKSFDGPSHSLL